MVKDTRTQRLNQVVKSYDRDLYAVRSRGGMLQIWRQGKAEAYLAGFYDAEVPCEKPQLILCLTDTWTVDGNPVDRGIEPTMHMLRSMDSWRDDSIYPELVKFRDQQKANADRARRNDIRARAMDLRKDFAKATNEINTSSL